MYYYKCMYVCHRTIPTGIENTVQINSSPYLCVPNQTPIFFLENACIIHANKPVCIHVYSHHYLSLSSVRDT